MTTTARTSSLRVFPTRQQIEVADPLFDDPEPPVRQLAPQATAPAVAQSAPARLAILPTHSISYALGGFRCQTTIYGAFADTVPHLIDTLIRAGAQPTGGDA